MNYTKPINSNKYYGTINITCNYLLLSKLVSSLEYSLRYEWVKVDNLLLPIKLAKVGKIRRLSDLIM